MTQTSEILNKIINEHPGTVMKAFTEVILNWMRIQHDVQQKQYDNFPILRDLLQYMDAAFENEKTCKLNLFDSDIYKRIKFPHGGKLPPYNHAKSIKISQIILTFLIPLNRDDALKIYAGLIVAWIFRSPEIPVKLTPRDLGAVAEDQTENIEIVEALWVWFIDYFSDPAWF